MCENDVQQLQQSVHEQEKKPEKREWRHPQQDEKENASIN